MPKITILLMGEHHEDAAASHLVARHIIKAKQLGLKIAVLSEQPCDRSLNDLIEKFKPSLEDGAALWEFKKLSKKPDGTYNRAEYLASPALSKFLKSYGAEGEFVEQHALNFLSQHKNTKDIIDTYPFVIEIMKFYQLIKESQQSVSFRCIDLPSAELKYLTKDLSKLPSIEKKRMQHMTQCALPELIKLSQTGGVIFITNLGRVHPHRLAYYLHDELKRNPLPYNASVELVPMRLFSSHPDITFSMKKIIALGHDGDQPFLALDTPEIHQFYQHVPRIDLECKTKKEGNYVCETFDALMKERVYLPLKEENAKLTRGYTYLPRKNSANKLLLFDITKQETQSTFHWRVEHNKKTFSVVNFEETPVKNDDDNDCSNRHRSILC
ncbi:MAG: hypothetical protein P4M12_07085 [Gammaproteobacteria bacterium]|nr:hypothetical protein [Gammaproteobacteria bacterium]